MYLTLKQQVKHLNKKEFRNLKYLSHIAKNLTNEAIYNIRQYYFKNRGKFKQENNIILGAKFQTTPFYQVEEKLQELIDNFLKSKENIIEKVAKFHAEFEKIHPFNDGNGRTGRLKK